MSPATDAAHDRLVSPVTRTARDLPAPRVTADEEARDPERDRPGLVEFVLDGLRGLYGEPDWAPRRPPTDELVLTILSQHTSDLNAERAFDELTSRFADWQSVAGADVDDVAAAIVSGGLARQKAPRIQAVLRRIREERGDFDLRFLAEMDPREARDWLVRFDGIGPKTASVVLLFCFGQPLMPVDTHVHRVTRRIGLIPAGMPADRAHDVALDVFPAARMYEAHVNLITHGRRTCTARNPACGRCPVAPRCRYVDPAAP
jgi:endonuclease III